MAEPTLEEYVVNAQNKSNLSITSNDINIELSKEFLEELQMNVYHGWIDDDVINHIAMVLKMIDSIYIPANTYKPLSPIKGQIIADFIAETLRKNSPIEHGGAKTSRLRTQEKTPIWTLYIDGASSNEVSGAGIILTDPDGKEIAYALRFEFSTSNNEVTYEALISVRLEVHHLQVFSDSLLVTTQVKGAYEAREGSMKRYLVKVQILKEKIEIFPITHIPRSKK
ncbi:reverse transcriptase domain-containing protein [Tanacetum coccineum]